MHIEEGIVEGDVTVGGDYLLYGTIKGSVLVPLDGALVVHGTVTGSISVAGTLVLRGTCLGDVVNNGGMIKIRGVIKGRLRGGREGVKVFPGAVIEEETS